MFVLFLDESGDHSLSKIDPQYPLFVLGGCIVKYDYHEKILTPRLKQYKLDLFGRDDFILHTADIVRRRGVFKKLTNKDFRKTFYEKTNGLMDELNYTIVACVVKKDRHLTQYGLAALDPYMLSLRVLVERFVFEVKAKGGGTQGCIVAEARDETSNNELRLAWMDLRTTGTEYISASEVRKYVSELYIKDKKTSIGGLQIADLIVSPIGRYVLGKDTKQDWRIIEKKFRMNAKKQYQGFGLVILPKK